MAAPLYYGGPPFFSPYIRFKKSFILPLEVNGAPINGVTGAGKAGLGSLAVDITTGVWYVNAGTKASPTWVPTDMFAPIVTGLVAHAGGGEPLATELRPGTNIVTTVATAGDSVELPLAVAGESVTVVNAAAGTPSNNASPYLASA